MRNNHQILHGDQTGYEEIFTGSVDHAPLPGQASDLTRKLTRDSLAVDAALQAGYCRTHEVLSVSYFQLQFLLFVCFYIDYFIFIILLQHG